MIKGRGCSAIPAQGRNDNCSERVNGAVSAPFTRSLTSVMSGLSRPMGWHHGSALARTLVLLLLPLSHGLLAQSYFQQQVDYRINVRLDDVKHELHARQEFDYLNNSPQALDTIWIHLWPNAYKGHSTALCEQLDRMNNFRLHFATLEQRGYIDSLDFRVAPASLPVQWGYHPEHIDIAWLKLPSPLAPGSSITFSTPFRVKIPSAAFSRLGHTGQAYYITQWFPKPAVYDREGWHAMPYLTQGEFYSEFGSFDVSITLPANYIVGATGELQTATEVAWLDSMAASGDAMTQAARGSSRPEVSAAMKTIRYTQDKIHDFAWFADKRFIVQKGSVTLPRSGNTVTTWTMFTPKYAKVWADAITYVNESVRLYSEWIGDYPYSACTAIDGGTAAGGGMEYPMITIINRTTDPFDLDVVIAHEVGHNWFYGMLASNERDHPWMDEGINSFYEMRYVETRYPNNHFTDLQGVPIDFLTRGKGITYHQQNELMYRFNARRNWDSPPDSPSDEFGMLDYGTTVYSKSALVFDQLRGYLGEAKFDSCMQRYFADWCFKHPYPDDIEYALREARQQGQDGQFAALLERYFKERKLKYPSPAIIANVWTTVHHLDVESQFEALIEGSSKYDTRICQVSRDAVRVKDRTSLLVPFTLFKNADTLSTTWKLAERGKLDHTALFSNAVDRFRVDGLARTLDIDRRNNEVRAHGLLKRRKLPEVKFLAGLEREDRKSIFWTPAIGKNSHDGFMAGLVLHNTTLPNQRFEWVAAPLYGTKSERLAGGARFMWHHDRLRSDWCRNIHVGISGFAASLWSVENVEQWYQRAVPSIQFDLRSKPNAAQTDLRYRSVVIWNNAKGSYFNGEQDVAVNEQTDDVFHEVRLHHERKLGLHPFDMKLVGLNHQAFSRLSLDATWSAIYDRQKHRVTLRAFGGTFLNKNDELMRREMGWRLHWGSSDLLYDHLFVDRQFVGQNTAQQLDKDQGGFKTPTANGTSDTWIAALNMEADFPFRLPLSLFASYGAAPYTTISASGKTTDWRGYWEMGIGVRIIRDVVEMWVPLAYSSEIKDEIEILRGFDFTERIRFVFALERMDPTQALRKAPH